MVAWRRRSLRLVQRAARRAWSQLPAPVRRTVGRPVRRVRRRLAGPALPARPAALDPARLAQPIPEGWTAALREAGWRGPDALVLTGWAYQAGRRDPAHTPRVSAVDPVTGTRLPVRTAAHPLPDVDLIAKDPHRSLRPACFRSVVDLRGAHVGSTWRIWIETGGAAGPLTDRLAAGSAGSLGVAVHGDRVVVPSWSADQGLEVTVRAPAGPVLRRGGQAWTLRGPRRRPVPALVWAGEAGSTAVGGRARLGRQLIAPPPAGGSWELRTAAGDPVLIASTPHVAVVADGWAAPAPTGELTAGHRLVVVDAADPDPAGVLQLRLRATPSGRYRIGLVGRRVRRTVEVELSAEPTGVAVPILVGDLTLPSDAYQLVVEAEGTGPAPLRAGPELVLGRWILRSWGRTRLEHDGPGLRVRTGAPVDPDHWGPYGEARLQAADRAHPDEPADLVYFESFNGRRAACNPLAVRHVLARQRPELRRVWAIEDGAVVTPAGDERVVIGTAEWRRARRTARWLVTNDWLRSYVPRPFQYFLQTWHGTPLKKLALDRLGKPAGFRGAVQRQVSGWDALVSQSPYMSEIMRGAYDYGGQVLPTGYPRNDLIHINAGRRDEIRAELGIPADAVAVLYAPTWREDGQNRLVRFLDPDALSERLGAGWTLLVRGHAANIPRDRQVTSGAIDVTLHPQVEELFVAADVLITDYSSVMFDFAVTGKPMIFFVPDLDDYCGPSRGVYFDLPATAPGPLVADLDDLVPALVASTDAAAWDAAWAERYRAWQTRFVPDDDGHAAERVVAAVFGPPGS